MEVIVVARAARAELWVTTTTMPTMKITRERHIAAMRKEPSKGWRATAICLCWSCLRRVVVAKENVANREF